MPRARKSSRKARHFRKDQDRDRASAGRQNACHVRLLDGEKVILKDQVLEVRNVDCRLHVARKQRRPDEDPPIPVYDPYGPIRTTSMSSRKR